MLLICLVSDCAHPGGSGCGHSHSHPSQGLPVWGQKVQEVSRHPGRLHHQVPPEACGQRGQWLTSSYAMHCLAYKGKCSLRL